MSIDFKETTPETSETPRKKKRKFRVGHYAINSWLIFWALVSVIPMLWLVLAPSKTDREVSYKNPLSFASFHGYVRAWKNLQDFNSGVLARWVLNSITYNLAIVLIASVTASLAGFVISASRIRFKKAFLISTLIMMLVPPVALVIPLFIEMNKANLIDNPMSVVLISSLYPFGAFLAYIYYSSTIPPELYESARLDGCSDFRLYTKIAFPLSYPLLALLAFFAFVGNWGNYFMPYIMLQSPTNYTLPVGLGALFFSTPAINPGNGATSVPILKPEIALAGILVAVPVMIVFLISQKRLIRGMLAGSIKE
jgi:multiple sugar transport system permease protein